MEKLEFAFQVMALGFFVVLLTLFLLYGVISVFSRFFYRPQKTPASVQDTGKGGAAATQTVGSYLSPQALAAISAAVCSYMQTAASGDIRFTITAVHPKPAAGKSWAAAGRKAILENNLALEQLRRKGF